MHFESVKIQNFRGIKELELDLKPGINILIGDNGMGKTTALEAMVVALGSYLLGVPKILSVGIQQDDFREEVEIIAGASKQKTYYSPNILFDLNLGGKTYSGSRTRTDRSGSKWTDKRVCTRTYGKKRKQSSCVDVYGNFSSGCCKTFRLWKNSEKHAG